MEVKKLGTRSRHIIINGKNEERCARSCPFMGVSEEDGKNLVCLLEGALKETREIIVGEVFTDNLTRTPVCVMEFSIQ